MIVKNFVFALLPALVLFGGVEFGLRALAEPSKHAPLLASTEIGLDVEDPKLFWKMRPNADLLWDGVRIRTNSLGLRDVEIPATKEEDEIRILSLGESTTFGAKVEEDETYSELLQRKLNKAESGRTFEVINAGVAAYTSFQSLIYLRNEGLRLRPDVVLFYHEFNDFLPTTGRTSFDIARFATLTDRRLYELRNFFGGLLYVLDKSETYRLMKRHLTRLRLGLLRKTAEESAGDGTLIEERVARQVRVPRSDKVIVFSELVKMSREHDFDLVVIHPTYRAVKDEHECFLREFTSENDMPLVETFEAFEKSGYSRKELFHDRMHPTALGHELIAEKLYEHLGREFADQR